jgi:hypothetical protein
MDFLTAKDCPVNCRYLLLNDHFAGCGLGRRFGTPIFTQEGGEAEIIERDNKLCTLCHKNFIYARNERKGD